MRQRWYSDIELSCFEYDYQPFSLEIRFVSFCRMSSRMSNVVHSACEWLIGESRDSALGTNAIDWSTGTIFER